MKIETVNIKKFKVLENFEQELAGNNILLLGDNGVGKSSFIEAIEIALGKSNYTLPGVNGKWSVVSTKDGKKYTFHVEVKEGKPVVTIEGPDGLKDKRKGTLSNLIGAVDFDINEFVNLSKTEAGRKKQLEIFKNTFLDAETVAEIERMNAHVKSQFEERAEVNKDVKALEVKEKSHPLTNQIDLSKYAPVDTKEVYAQVLKIQDRNNKIKEVETRDKERSIRIAQRMKEIEELEKKQYQLRELQQEEMTQHSAALEFLNKNPQSDISDFEKKLNDATEINKLHEQAQELIKIRVDLECAKEEAGEMTVALELQRQAIADKIREMKTPIDGLSFDEENLLYKGVIVSPDTLSTSEVMELGVRLKMAENPELGVLFLQHGESLGEQRFKDIMDLAKKAGWQVIMEQVERGNKNLKLQIIAE